MMRFLPWLSLVALLAAAPTGVGAEKSNPEDSLARVRDRIRALESSVKQGMARRSQSDQELSAAELSAARARQDLVAVRQHLADARRQRAELVRQLGAAEAELARQRSALGAQLRLAWVNGQGEQLQVVLTRQDPALLGRRLTYLGYLTRSRNSLLQAVQTSLAALQASKDAVEKKEAELARLEQAQKKELMAIETARRDRAAIVARLDAQMKNQDRELRRLRSQAEELERLVRKLQQALAAKPSPRDEDMGRPLKNGRWPVSGRLLADYGQSRAGGQMRWDGVLIGAPAGTEVKAIRGGRVVYSDWLPGMGLLLVMDHGSGYLSLYGHNQDLAKAVGDRVAPGDVISHVGDTGGQGQPALYFEIRRNGRPEDPHGWVR